jgi:hypothetical protein
MDQAAELVKFLREMISRYRDRHNGQPPANVYASADVFVSLVQDKEPQRAIKTTSAGYVFDGVRIEPKPSQSLPFVLRP